MLQRRTRRTAVAAVLTVLGAFAGAMPAAAKTPVSVCWSHYTGWEPWAYAEKAGILKKWADKYDLELKLVLINDYIESINLYTAGKFAACTMTNMDALTIPAVGGVDSTALIIGDFSNGNDGIVLKDGKSFADLKKDGRKVKLVEMSVSHYLLARGLSMNGMKEKELALVNTSDADIGAVFTADAKGAAVTWNPILMKLKGGAGVTEIFDSSKIPGEIIDMMVVKTDAPEGLKKALVGAWFETLAIMNGSGKQTDDAIEFMAKNSGGTVAEFKDQLKTTAMFYKAQDAVDFVGGKSLASTMEYVRTFSFEHGLLGQGAKDKDFVGIALPDGTTLGAKSNVKLRFSAETMKMQADGKL